MLDVLKKRGRFLILSFVILLLIFIRYAFKIEVPRIVITALICLVAVLGNPDENLAILLACIPMHNAVNFYLSILVCAVSYVIKSKRGVKAGFGLILLMVMMIYELMHGYVGVFDLTEFLVGFAPFIVLIIILSIDVQGIDYAFISRIMAVYAISMGLMLVVNLVLKANGNVLAAIANMQRLGVVSDGDTLIGGGINPNSMGIINLIATIGLMQVISRGEGNKLDVVFVITLIMLAVLTLSRTFFACFILSVTMWIFGQVGTWKKSILRIIYLVVVFCMLFLVIKVAFPSVIDNFISRFQANDFTSGRDSLMSRYHEYIVNHHDVLLWGIGLNNFNEKVVGIFNIAVNVPHNSLQEIIVAWGIPGLIMVILILWMILSESNKYLRKKTLLNYIPLVIILSKTMVGQLITSGYTVLALSFAYLSLCQDFSPKSVTLDTN